MERSEILTTMAELKLYGMKAAYDEIIGTAVKRQHEPTRIVGDLLTAEISEKQARSIRYQITIAKLPLAKDVDDFAFDGTPINQTLVRDLAGGEFLAHQRNVVLVGGTGTGKTHLAIAIARACIRDGARGRFFNVVDLVNRLEAETRSGRQGRMGRDRGAERPRGDAVAAGPDGSPRYKLQRTRDRRIGCLRQAPPRLSRWPHRMRSPLIPSA
jgi:DNA replication protein DnaC